MDDVIERSTRMAVDVNAILAHRLKPIQHLFEIEGVNDICVDRFDKILIVKGGEKILTDAKFQSETEVVQLVRQIANSLGQEAPHEINRPKVDGSLPNGTRVNATLYPLASSGSNITFRCFPKCSITPNQLVEYGSLTQEMLDYLKLAVEARLNILVCGSTGSGKTSLINALAHFIGETDRIVSVEDVQELRLEHAFSWLPMLVFDRPKLDVEQQEINLSIMIGDALRKLPDRIFVGEIRYPDAAYAYLTGLNTGHNGCMSTVHANGCEDALERMDDLVASYPESRVPFDFIQKKVRKNINLVVFQEKTHLFGRRVTEVAEVDGGELKQIFRFDHELGKHVSSIECSSIKGRATKYGVESNLLDKMKCS